MPAWLLNWLISAVALFVAAKAIKGIDVSGFGPAIVAAVVIGFLNATLGWLMKLLMLPVTILTFGLFLLVVNAFLLWLAAAIVPGLSVRSFWAAFFGAIVMSVVGMLLRSLIF